MRQRGYAGSAGIVPITACGANHTAPSSTRAQPPRSARATRQSLLSCPLACVLSATRPRAPSTFEATTETEDETQSGTCRTRAATTLIPPARCHDSPPAHALCPRRIPASSTETLILSVHQFVGDGFWMCNRLHAHLSVRVRSFVCVCVRARERSKTISCVLCVCTHSWVCADKKHARTHRLTDTET